MLPSKLDDVTLADLQQLVTDALPESKVIEYKKAFYVLNHADPDEKRKQHEELLKDVSCFANSIGGDVIIGVEAKDGVPTDVCGFTHPNPDGLKLQLTEILQQHLEPRISASMAVVPHSTGRIVLVIRVHQSTIAPHRVVYQKQPGQFWARSDANAYRMDVSEIRRAFAGSKSLADEITKYRNDRISAIESSHTPVPLAKAPTIACHLIPTESFSSAVDHSISEIATQFHDLHPLRASRAVYSVPKLDGYVTCDNPAVPPVAGYVQVFRNGVIEVVNAYDNVFHDVRDSEKKHPAFSTYQEFELIQRLPSYIKALTNLGTQPPLWFYMSLLGFRGVRVFGDHNPGLPFDRDRIDLPKVEIKALQGLDFATVLKPVFDALWNAAGHERCFDYTVNGVFRRPR